MTHHRERFVDAITHAASIAGDEDIGQEGAKLFRDLESDLAGLLEEDDEPSLACLSFLRGDKRNHTALTVLLRDRLVIGWRSGLFRKRFESLTVPYSTITGISSRSVAPDPSLGGNPIVRIEADRPIVIAIPPKGSPLAVAVRNSVINAMGAHRN